MPNTNDPVSCKECGSQVTMGKRSSVMAITDSEQQYDLAPKCTNGQCDTNDTGLLAPPKPL